MLTVFKNITSTLKYLLMCVGYNVKQSVANKKSFVIQTIAMFINNFVFILFWKIVFNVKGGNINGLVMDDIMYLWSIPTIGYGITFFCFGGVESLCKDIAEGNLDIYLTKPKNSLISTLTSKSILSAMGDLLFGIVCGIIAVKFNPLKLIGLLLLGIVSGIITVCVMTSIRLLAFWLGDISNACNKYTNSLLITLTIYPEKMFPVFIKVLMYTVVPAMYMAHIPVKLVNHFSLKGLVILLIAMVILLLITKMLYERGLKRYESGNSVTRR